MDALKKLFTLTIILALAIGVSYCGGDDDDDDNDDDSVVVTVCSDYLDQESCEEDENCEWVVPVTDTTAERVFASAVTVADDDDDAYPDDVTGSCEEITVDEEAEE